MTKFFKEEKLNLMKKFLMSAMVFILLFSAGCEEKNNPPQEKNSPTQQTSNQNKNENKNSGETEKISATSEKNNSAKRKEKTLQVKIYFPDDAGMNLISVKRKITIAKDEEKYFETAKLLTEKPKEKNLTKIFPNHAKINSVHLKGDTAFVNFDGSITKNFVGGSTGEEMLINSFVQTLTEFPEVKQVKFLIDGQDVETLAGHMDLSVPIKRQ